MRKIVQVLKIIKPYQNTGKDGMVIWIMLAALRLLESALRVALWINFSTSYKHYE